VHPGEQAALEVLEQGRIEISGRLVDASNATLFGSISHNGTQAHCVYKPITGERPLWDFPDGTLADREVATYLVSRAAGFDLVPPTVLRPGPFGPGMVQLWVDTDEDADLIDMVGIEEVPAGWRTVLHARDRHGAPAVLVHADHPRMRLMAAMDVVVNNADRKGGHVLHTASDGVYGVDHGLCLHAETKLRTVLWGWLGESLPAEVVEALRTLRAGLDGDLAERLAAHLTRREMAALATRTDLLLARAAFPEPSGDWPPIPWPAF